MDWKRVRQKEPSIQMNETFHAINNLSDLTEAN